MNHTKGDWELNEANDIVVRDGTIIQTRICSMIEHREEFAIEDKANACLVAAAPDLLDACKKLIAHSKETDIIDECADDGDGRYDTWQSSTLSSLLIAIECAIDKAE